MNRSSISKLAKALVAKDKLKQEQAEQFIRMMFEVAQDALDADKSLKMRWLGTFKVQTTKDRESVDVNTGERIVIEGRDKISFTPDNVLKELVNKPFSQFETVIVNDDVDFTAIDEKYAGREDEPLEDESSVDAPVSDELVTDEPAAEEVSPIESAPVSEEIPAADVSLVPKETPTEEISEEERVEIPQDDDATEEAADIAEEETTVVESPQIVETEPIAVIEDRPRPVIEPRQKKETRTGHHPQFCKKFIGSMVSLVTTEEEDKPETPAKPEHEAAPQPVAAPEPVSESEPVVESKSVTESESVAESEQEEESPNKDRTRLYQTLIVAMAVLVAILIVGFAWFTVNYQKMSNRYEMLAVQLDQLKKEKEKPQPVVPDTVAAKPAEEEEDSVSQELKEKAKQDSARMAQASKAVEMAEQAAEKKDSVTPKKTTDQDKYNKDVRIRTGAYRIAGTAKTITVKPGQTMASISTIYLGAGMECYIEAYNGTKKVKAGQTLKIPKLELKKRSKK